MPATEQAFSPNERLHTPAAAIWGILAISAVASLFLAWLVYLHPPIDTAHNRLLFLPSLNAVFNACSAVALVVGVSFIRRRQVRQHRASMFTAFVFSTLFLVSYIANHALHGEYRLPIAHAGALWTTYLTLLSSHIFLSVIALPLVLITFFLSLSERFAQHRRLARWTYPIWLYVSVTGVVVAVIQAIVRR